MKKLLTKQICLVLMLAMLIPMMTFMAGAADIVNLYDLSKVKCGTPQANADQDPKYNANYYCSGKIEVQPGDVEIIASGHLHKHISDGVYGGIRFALDACAGFAIGGVDTRRGGRIFDIRNDGTHETHMIYAKDYIDVSKPEK